MRFDYLAVMADNKRLWAAVVLVLTLVEKDGAPFKKQDLSDDETIALYVHDCACLGLTDEMVFHAMDAVRHRRLPNGELAPFPRPDEFAHAVKEHVRDTWPSITTPTLVEGEERWSIKFVNPDGPEWRRHVAAVQARSEEDAKALPDLEERDRQKARLESALPKLAEKRMDAPRERAAKVEADDPEAAEKRRAMVERLRESEGGQ